MTPSGAGTGGHYDPLQSVPEYGDLSAKWGKLGEAGKELATGKAYVLDDTLPLTPPEWPEWGNPIESASDYATIKAYSPYENIREIDYPHILATGGLTDPRVTYWEPAKWIARLRARRTDEGLSLLRTEMTAGHGGKAGRFNQLHEVAFVYAFVIFVHTVLREKEE